jgi:uncharacterized protein YbcI
MCLDRPGDTEVPRAISEEIVKIHARSYGSHPAGTKVAWNEDILVCVLEGDFTAPERALIEAGRFDRVRGDRTAMREALEPTLRALVETLTGLPVDVYMGEVNQQGDAFETFVLGGHDRPPAAPGLAAV